MRIILSRSQEWSDPESLTTIGEDWNAVKHCVGAMCNIRPSEVSDWGAAHSTRTVQSAARLLRLTIFEIRKTLGPSSPGHQLCLEVPGHEKSRVRSRMFSARWCASPLPGRNDESKIARHPGGQGPEPEARSASHHRILLGEQPS